MESNRASSCFSLKTEPIDLLMLIYVNLFLNLGISIHKAADQVEEIQAETDEIMSQLQELKFRLKSLEPISVYEEPILSQVEEHKVCRIRSISIFK